MVSKKYDTPSFASPFSAHTSSTTPYPDTDLKVTTCIYPLLVCYQAIYAYLFVGTARTHWEEGWLCYKVFKNYCKQHIAIEIDFQSFVAKAAQEWKWTE